MRPIEASLCNAVLIGTVLLIWGHLAVGAGIALLIVIGALLAIHLIYEGAHWQVYPLYAACVIFVTVAVAIFFAPNHALHEGIVRWILRGAGGASLLLLLAAYALGWLVPMFRLPEPDGPYRVGTRILHLVDPKRDAEGGNRPGSQRELMVQVWYPAEPVRGKREVYRRRAETTFKSSYQSVLRTQSLREAPVLASDAPYPLLVFNPAWTGQRTQSTFLMQELASHGFVVASIDHTCYSGLVAFPDGRVLDGHMAPALGDFTHLSLQEGIDLVDQFVRILAEDVIFVVDRMTTLNEDPQSVWHGGLDRTRVGALGHSIGGAAAAEACALSPHIHAAINLDGWTFGEVLRRGLAKPWMVIYGKGSEIQPPDLASQPMGVQRYWQMNRENYAAVEASLRRTRGYSVTIRGASHWNFSDRPLYSPLRSRTEAGSIRPERAYRIISEVTRAFFSESLKGDESGSVSRAVQGYAEVELAGP